MGDPAAVAQREQHRSQDLLVGLMALPLRLIGVLCGSLLLSVLIECIGVYALWPLQSWHHAQGMLDDELRQFSASFARSLIVSDPQRTAEHLTAVAYDRILLRTGLLDWAQQDLPKPPSANARHRRMPPFLRVAYDRAKPYVLAGAYTVLMFAVRLLVIGLTVPLFLMTAFVGFIDGLVRRDLRRFAAGYESGFLHHRARAMILPAMILPAFLYLAMPVSVSPLLVLLPGAAFLGVAINVTAASFKKYL